MKSFKRWGAIAFCLLAPACVSHDTSQEDDGFFDGGFEGNGENQFVQSSIQPISTFDDPKSATIAGDLIFLVNRAISNARLGEYNPPAYEQRSEIFLRATCLHFWQEQQGFSEVATHGMLDRFFYRIIRTPDRHAAYDAFSHETSFNAFDIQTSENTLMECETLYPSPPPPPPPPVDEGDHDPCEDEWRNGPLFPDLPARSSSCPDCSSREKKKRCESLGNGGA